MNYREKMREYLKEPNQLSSQYGKWGILNREQRQMITRLLDEMDRADIYIKELFFKNEAYENMRKEEIDYLHNLRNFKIKYNKKSATNPIEEELFASDKDFIKDLLNILNKVGSDK